MSKALQRLGRSAAGHPWRAIAVWVLVAAGLVVAGQGAGVNYNNNYRIPGAQSQVAVDRLNADFPALSGSSDQIVLHATRGTLLDPGPRAGLEAALAGVSRLPHVSRVATPGMPGGDLSRDGTIGFATVSYDRPAIDLENGVFAALQQAMAPARTAGVQVEFSGDLVAEAEKPDVGSSDQIGLAVALVVLILAFGSVVAAGLPIGTAIVGLAIGLSAVGLLSTVVDVPSTTPTLATMIGLGVGIDYALFIITRHREQLAAGHSVIEAAGHANATAGQSVIFAGGTVVIAICGLAITGIPFVTSLGYSTAVVVAVAVLAAISLMPALLGLVGTRINSLKVPGIHPPAGADAGDEHGFWSDWAHRIGRRPWPYALVSLGMLVVLCLPVFSMRLGQADNGTLPKTSTQRRAYDLLSKGFGKGFNGPLTVVVELPAAGGADGMAKVGQTLAADRGIAAVTPPQLSPSGHTAVLTAIPTTSPQDPATTALVRDLRAKVLPKATAGTGVTAMVTGSTAGFIDLSSRISSRLPVFIVAVVGLSFLLLMSVFRSVLVPLKAAVMNILSVGAAYGVVVAVFQWGWLKGLVGLDETIPIESWVPMMMFAILFGLSMDYEVFLLSRIREDWQRQGDSHLSVVEGLSSTARVITSAAIIMVSVFASFVLINDAVVKMFGVGLASAVLVDATLIRMVLVPATMELLGDANWWLPRFLDRVLPHLDLEGPAEVPAPEPT